MKTTLLAILVLGSISSFASTCSDLQMAEAKIISAAYYETPNDTRGFCYFLSRAVSSKEGKRIGLDGIVQGGIEFCVSNQNKISAVSVAKETTGALKVIKNCFSQIGQ